MGFMLTVKGDFDNTKKQLEKMFKSDYRKVLESAGERGVEALQEATPKRTGLTASSWRYEIIEQGRNTSLFWTNDNRTSQGDLIVILLQYGHGTGRGGYVHGRDFINPAIQPIFDSIAEDVWKVMTEK